MRIRSCVPAVSLGLLLAAPCLGDDWVMNLTVDNQFDVYFGTPTSTLIHAGNGNWWPTTYTFNAFNMPNNAYLYIATASDHSVAQGFIGDFTNTTKNKTALTGDVEWEVFAAGAHQATNPYWPAAWPAGLQPTQGEVDNAIAYAEANGLWEAPDTEPGNNFNGTAPWGFRPGIDPDAIWIWHDAFGDGFPLSVGRNNDEFLVFRIAGVVPAPSSASILALSALTLRRRR